MKKQKTIYITSLDMRRLRDMLLNASQVWDKSYLQKLECELDRARIVEPQAVPGNIITMNSTVRLVDLETGEDLVLTLVYPDQSNISEGKISVIAPVGTAILGCKKGDTVEWEVPDGVRAFKVDRILFQPEASGEYTL